jgi:1A family penicillin-binding protein
MAVLAVAVLVGLLVWALQDVPWQEIADGSLKPVVVLETADGEPLVTQGPLQGPYAAPEDFPKHLIDAVISAEDRRFYEHAGIDLRGIARAMLSNARAGGVVEGGSTITQQLIKILYLESDRTLKRKIQEAVIALWLERRLGKDEILARYLNNVYLGAGATGIPAAASIYFDKEVDGLDLAESAMLAGLIRAPSQLNPLENPQAARQRTATVLDSMVANGRLDADAAAAAKSEFAQLNPTESAARSGSWFADWVVEEAREIAGPYRGTIRVSTSIVPRLQAIAEEVVTRVLDEEGAESGASQAALVAMRPDGSVVAMVGGRDYDDSAFNRAVTALRQPGSAFKLFTYYAALKAGISLDDRIEDAPMEIGDWEPENFDGEYHGMVTVAEAFVRSLNAATVALAMEVGIDKVIEAARELGIDARLGETPSVVLGSYETSLLDLTGAYASIRTGMAPVEAWGIASFHAEGQPRSFRVGAPKQPDIDVTAYQGALVQLLQQVVDRGTGRAAALDGFAAGKTGTSQNFRDAWFVGFTEPLIAGVWVGNDDETPMHEVTGGKLPARIWREFMTKAVVELGGGGRKRAVPPPVASAKKVPPETADAERGEGPAPVEDGVAPVIVRDGADEGSIVSVLPGPDTTGTQAAEPLACNYRACSRKFRSFRPADCTYQPYSGPRRLCSEGAPSAAANDVAAQEAAASGRSEAGGGSAASCNFQACSRSYRSFRPSDCTYQPYRGPRRLCTR